MIFILQRKEGEGGLGSPGRVEVSNPSSEFLGKLLQGRAGQADQDSARLLQAACAGVQAADAIQDFFCPGLLLIIDGCDFRGIGIRINSFRL